MSLRLIAAITLAATLLSTWSCSAPSHDSNSSEKAGIHRFDISVSGYENLDSTSRVEFLDSFQSVANILVRDLQANPDSALSAYAQSDAVQLFTPDIKARYRYQDSIEGVLGQVKAGMGRLLPGVTWPEIYAIVSPYNQAVILSDSIMLIGLNHYLGTDYEAYDYFDTYLRKTKTPRHQPYDIAEALIATQYPYSPGDSPTLLSRMLYEGALLHAIEAVMPHFSLGEAIGYTDDELDRAQRIEGQAWKNMIDKGLLFSSSPHTIDRIVRQAPSTAILHPDAPGRMGRYIGYMIVNDYLDRFPSTTPEQLLTRSFYNSSSTLVKSGFNPTH